METQLQVARNREEDNKRNEGQRNPTSPSSNSSSPAHEFTFTISLHPSSKADKNKSNPSFAIDLTPADEIFFHGHLLPLHLLSNLPVSPRSSTDSLDSFTLPIKDFADENNNVNSSTNYHEYINIDHVQESSSSSSSGSSVLQETEQSKSRSFSWIPKWRKGIELTREQKGNREEDQKQKRKPKIDISNAVKRYMRLIKPFLSFGRRRMNHPQLHRQAYSFSGNFRVRSRKEVRGKRGEYSAPASMRTSPANSGLLVASGTTTPSSTSDSTMEELQAAIQSAIAHCKKSIATENKNNTP